MELKVTLVSQNRLFWTAQKLAIFKNIFKKNHDSMYMISALCRWPILYFLKNLNLSTILRNILWLNNKHGHRQFSVWCWFHVGGREFTCLNRVHCTTVDSILRQDKAAWLMIFCYTGQVTLVVEFIFLNRYNMNN